jgi:hypothetical protein
MKLLVKLLEEHKYTKNISFLSIEFPYHLEPFSGWFWRWEGRGGGTTRRVTKATVVASCKTFSKTAYGDTTLHSKGSAHGSLDSISSVAEQEGDYKNARLSCSKILLYHESTK